MVGAICLERHALLCGCNRDLGMSLNVDYNLVLVGTIHLDTHALLCVNSRELR